MQSKHTESVVRLSADQQELERSLQALPDDDLKQVLKQVMHEWERRGFTFVAMGTAGPGGGWSGFGFYGGSTHLIRLMLIDFIDELDEPRSGEN